MGNAPPIVDFNPWIPKVEIFSSSSNYFALTSRLIARTSMTCTQSVLKNVNTLPAKVLFLFSVYYLLVPGYATCYEDWEDTISTHIGDNYVLVKSASR